MRKYPSSIQVALYSSAVLSVIFFLILLILGMLSVNTLLATLGFFTASLVTISFMIEFYVYAKLKLFTETSELEIRKLKDMETFRREFIGDVSHELKTPIFAIEGFLETLLDGALEDKKVNRKFLQKALKHSERLENLVQDLLTITQIESGDLGMNLEEFSLYDLVREIVDSLENKFTKKGRDISCVIEPHDQESTMVLADRDRIQQVLYNLIDNAVKYGDMQGTVVVELLDLNEKVQLKVIDNGPGIDPVHIPRLFERFYRVDKSRSRNKGGTGLGLSICKHLLEAHKEKIWVESKLGKGTTMNFTLAKAKEQ